MRKLLKRSLSLLLAFVMVLGLMQTNLTAQAAESTTITDLTKADGIIWLAKDEANDSVSKTFEKMVTTEFMLDDLVRVAVGEPEDSKAKVVYDGVDVGNVIEIMKNQSTVEGLVDEMKDAIKGGQLIEFTVGGKAKLIAFKNVANAEIKVNDEDAIYVSSDVAPKNAAELEAWIDDALNSAKVVVNGELKYTGVKFELGSNSGRNIAGYEGSDLMITRNQTVENLLAKWPTIDTAEEYLAGTVTVTIKAVEYDRVKASEQKDYKKEVSIPVYLKDSKARGTVTVLAVQPEGAAFVDSEVSNYEATYQGYVGQEVTVVEPSLYNYSFQGWKDDFDGTAKVTAEGSTYYAVVKPRVDINGNGVADKNEVYTITYEYSDGTVKSYDLAYGTPTTSADIATGYVWKTEGGIPWQPYVYGNMTYVQTEIRTTTEVSVEANLLYSGSKFYSDKLVAKMDGNYYLEDPNWETFRPVGYKSSGFYTLVKLDSSSAAVDMNNDGIAAEYPFIMHNGENCTDDVCSCTTITDDEISTVKLFYDIYRVNDEGLAIGTQTNPLYIYEFEAADGIIFYEFDAANRPATLNPEYGTAGKYEYFAGWDFTNLEDKDDSDYAFRYTVKPVLVKIENTVSVSDNIKAVLEDEETSGYVYSEAYVDGKLELTWTHETETDYYKAYVIVSDMTEDGNFPIDDKTELTVSPIYKLNDVKGTKSLFGYVSGLSWNYVDGTAKDIDVQYDYDNNAYNTAAFADQKDGKSIVLNLNYGYFDLQTKSVKVAAGSSMSKEELEKALVKVRTDFSDLGETAYVTEYYARPEVDVKIDLYKLYELFNSEGLGVLLDNIDQFPETVDIKLDEKWQLIEKSPKHEMTAQEVADAYLSKVYNELKADKFVSIEEFVGEFLKNLEAELDANYVHKFGYVGSTMTRAIAATELVRVTYSNAEIYATAEQEVVVDDSRKAAWFEVNGDVVSAYNNGINGKLLENVKLVTEDGKELNVKKLYEAGYIVTNDADSTREYDIADVGTYNNVTLTFKGNEEYKPAVSPAFGLTVKKVDAKVEVDEMIAVLKGTDIYKDANATVTPYAPYVQIVAGIAANEFMLDENLALADNKVVIDAWVKLPQTYVDLLNGLELETLNGFKDGVEFPAGTIQAGVYYEREHLIEELEKYADTKHYGSDQVKQVLSILDRIPEKVLSRLGVDDLNVTLRIRLDAAEKNVYPTESGFYVNFAATLASVTGWAGSEDKNYGASEDYGFIVISPMVPVPNTGAANVGLQLYDEKLSNVQNVFVYEYNGEAIERDLEVAFNGETLEGEEPFYYGLTTRFDATKQAPVKPGVYFAGYNYTKMVDNTDSGEMELRRIDSDSAIIIIKQREVDLEIKGEIVEYDGNDHIADIIVTDKKGNVVNDAGVTVISGTVNVDTVGTNVSTNDLYGTVNVDLPDGLQELWDAYCNEKWGKDALDKFAPSDVLSFFEDCAAAAEANANGAIEVFKELALKNAVSSALEKINNYQSYVDVSSGNIVNKATRVQHILTGGKVYFDKLIAEFKPLAKYDDNVFVTFYDLDTEADKLDYEKTGAYLYVGVVTDPDTTTAAGKGLVIIHSAEDYIMYDTHVPYNGQPQTIEMDDTSIRGDIQVMIDRANNEVKFFLDGDVYKAINAVLASVLGEGEKISDGTDGYVATAYTKTKSVGDAVSDKLVEIIKDKATNRITNKFLGNSDKLDQALNALNTKIDNLTVKIVNKLEDIDKMPNDTRIVVYERINDEDLYGMPVNVGTYEFFGYDYDVAATRGKLVIEPIYIVIDDDNNWKYVGEADPDPLTTVKVTYYGNTGLGTDAEMKQISVDKLPKNFDLSKVVKYSVSRDGNDEIGIYNMTVEAELLDKSGNYAILVSEDGEDFEIRAYGEIAKGGQATLSLEGEVYIEYFPVINGFDGIDLTGKGGLVIWKHKGRPSTSALIDPRNTDDCYVLDNMRKSDLIDGYEYVVTSKGINAKEYGDVLYMRSYVKINETYYLGPAFPYSPEMYCEDKLTDEDTGVELKTLCASLLEYGSAAQECFDYNTSNLVNAGWDFSEYDLAFADTMLDDIVLPTGKNPQLTGDVVSIDKTKSTLSLEGAIVLEVVYHGVDLANYDHGKVLVWTKDDFANTNDFTYNSKSATFEVPLSWGTLVDYTGYVATLKTNDENVTYVGIPAKECGDTVYFMAYFVTTDGKYYRSKIGCFSPDEYVRQTMNSEKPEVVKVSKALAVYSERAREYFDSINSTN